MRLKKLFNHVRTERKLNWEFKLTGPYWSDSARRLQARLRTLVDIQLFPSPPFERLPHRLGCRSGGSEMWQLPDGSSVNRLGYFGIAGDTAARPDRERQYHSRTGNAGLLGLSGHSSPLPSDSPVLDGYRPLARARRHLGEVKV